MVWFSPKPGGFRDGGKAAAWQTWIESMVGKQGRAWNIQGKLVKHFQLCFWGRPEGCSATEVSWWEIPGRKGAWRSCCKSLGTQRGGGFHVATPSLAWRIPAGRGLAASVEFCHISHSGPRTVPADSRTYSLVCSANPTSPCHVLVSPLGSGLWSRAGFAG